MEQKYYDVELKMHAFRLMRSGNYTKIRQVMAAMKEDFPEASDQQLKRVMRELAQSIAG